MLYVTISVVLACPKFLGLSVIPTALRPFLCQQKLEHRCHAAREGLLAYLSKDAGAQLVLLLDKVQACPQELPVSWTPGLP